MQRAQLFFHRFACGLIVYNLLVVVWGAFVRASRSGDGCGENWPHCGDNGTFIPTGTHAATWIEWTHRASTSVLGPLLLAMVIWAFVSFGKNHPVRKAAIGVTIFTVIEAWIGAHLVRKGLVVDNASTQRVIWMSLHLANILSLFGCLTLTAWWSGGGARWSWRGQGKLGAMWTLCYVGIIALAITGAISALGDMLHPVDTLMEGIRQDFASEATLILKTRPLHPLTATLVSLWTLWTIMTSLRERPSPQVKKLAPLVLGLLGGQYLFGWWNLLILAPIWAQLTHLLLANLLWIGLILLGAATLAAREHSLAPQASPQLNEDGEVREWSKQAPSVS